MLAAVAMPEPERILERYSYELSGGMCQRVVIALALAWHGASQAGTGISFI